MKVHKQTMAGVSKKRTPKKALQCWEAFQCNKKKCPSYKSKNTCCWLFSGTHCRDDIRGTSLEKIEICLGCTVFKRNIDDASFKSTCRIINRKFKESRQLVHARDRELSEISMELALGITEVFEALKKIASGDPTVRIKETSKIELLKKLKHMVNQTAKEIGEIVDQTHEIAIVIAEHFDVLHRVTKGDLDARVKNNSKIALMDSLKREINNTIASISREIDERKRAEKTIKAREERFKQIAENAEEWIWEVDADGLYIYSSPIVEKILGYKPEEIIGKKHFYDFFYPGERKRLKSEALNVFALRQPFREFHNRNVSKTGKTVWLSTSAVPVLDENGNLLGYRGADTDITNHKISEDVLRESEKFLSDIFESIQDGMSVLDKNLNIIRVNHVMKTWYGQNAPLEGKKCYVSYQNRDKPCDPCPSLRCLRSGETERDIVPGIKGSAVEWIELFSYPIKDPDTGKVIAIVEFVRDITERKRVQKILQESEKRYRDFIENADDIIQSVDRNGNFSYVNKKWRETLGYSREESKQLHFTDIIDKGYKTRAEIIFEKICNGEIFEQLETVFITKDGQKINVEGNLNALFENGKFIATRCIFRDITRRKKAENALKNSEKELKERVKELEEFYDVAVGREIRMIELKKEIENLNQELGKYRNELYDSTH